MKDILTTTLVCLFAIAVNGQEQITISGYLKDSLSGENLIAANIYDIDQPQLGTTTNQYGFYSLVLPKGVRSLVFTYLGYKDKMITISLEQDTLVEIELAPGKAIQFQEVVVTAEDKAKNVEKAQMGVVELPVDKIQKLPALFGETDILKTLQLMPGVLSAGEGNAGFYVRGGGPDQNLVLLDEAVVYNAGHLFGFFSVFNTDAIKNTTLIKGGMPAKYGGRLSSVVDVQMKEGNDKTYNFSGGVGLVSSKLTLEGPIQKERSSFILSGRRTYVLDLAQPIINQTDFAGTNYFFYDLNVKANHRFSSSDRLFVSAYFGRDILKFNNDTRDFQFDLPYGNATGTIRWNHLFNSKLFMNVSAIYNEYDFGFNGSQAEWEVDVFSGVRDYNFKVDFDFYPNPKHHFQFGTNYTYHRLNPNIASATNGNVNLSNDKVAQFAHESAFYVLDDIKWSSRFTTNVGLRFSLFTQLGPYQSIELNEDFSKGEPVKSYAGLEPRVTTKYSLQNNASLKAGITRTYQYLHLVSNSTSTLPSDVWVPSTQLVKPQIGWQYALGYFKNFKDNQWETSVEVYYKDLQNQIDYGENFVNNPANDLERDFVFGSGESYGAEFFIRKNTGKLTGWIGYTLSKTERTFPDINDGKVFPAIYDRRHDLAIVANYDFNLHWSLGGNFVYGSGNAFTPIRSLYFIDQDLVLEYGGRNSARLEAYHRMDIALTWTPRPNSEKHFSSSWTFSVYNLYNRLNPFFVYYNLYSDPEEGTAGAEAIKVSLFPAIPSISWNFKWR